MNSIAHNHIPARKRWRSQVLPKRRHTKRRDASVASIQPPPQNDALLAKLERELSATNILLSELQIQLSALERERDKLVRRIRLHRKKTTK